MVIGDELICIMFPITRPINRPANISSSSSSSSSSFSFSVSDSFTKSKGRLICKESNTIKDGLQATHIVDATKEQEDPELEHNSKASCSEYVATIQDIFYAKLKRIYWKSNPDYHASALKTTKTTRKMNFHRELCCSQSRGLQKLLVFLHLDDKQ
ncbi:hypothetical protein PHYBLDRAFT_181517 [Phycomyces blakesleeanus NRRL 1555(-)]|uniref:Uncharacterized protein n=1 Tax=Phycomyces blakesleeanus (strain ATCC 8743b / DSM 1359 / FGSC 10004 / NBRC 33097 / NRRL 1555) TaxID=763407 RepID=A0A167MNR8_PHYB8|nr:hypothetical protein PHYBLDRAFT_181517 [Phycomyces blakesleeanus NRRL 1555(-)]OAD73389.1 hypothetical protein PHYBLDRAFT_181517 [Phycomyces blakesleeanus NRRL 1555(-)]|eukprot:XP_018291429.1 hypothetical protein PHYBLDRAFT_181517 [Phycomyces blakesleeanus NRRL 1555(-)]